MSINLREIEHLAKLAKLKLSDEEKIKFSQEISSILRYVDKLQELRVAEQEEDKKSQAGVRPDWRDDYVVGVAVQEQRELIGLSPENQDNLIKTQPVFN